MGGMKELMTKLRKSFFAGLLVVLPVAASVMILMSLFEWVTNFMVPPSLRDKMLTPVYRVAAFVLFVGLTTTVGWVTRLVIGKRMVNLSEGIIERIPVLNRTYAFMKEISRTFLSGRKTMFKRVVLVEFPHAGMHSLGFVTSESGGEAPSKLEGEVVTVFVPTTPNPTAGFLLMAPRGKTIPLEMSVGDGMKMVISGGSVVPPWPQAGGVDDGR
jgi:uncharacterized membrane protein